MLDLGKEFGIGPVDGAHELPISELSEALVRAGGARYRHPGACLKAAQSQVLSTIGQPKKAVESKLESDFGLESGRREAVLTTLAVEFEQFKSSADPLKAAAQKYAAREGISLERAVSGPTAGAQVDSSALLAAQAEMKSHWLNIAKAALKAGGLDPNLVDATPEESKETVTETAAEGRFDADKHVGFTSIAQWAQADLHRWYYRQPA